MDYNFFELSKGQRKRMRKKMRRMETSFIQRTHQVSDLITSQVIHPQREKPSGSVETKDLRLLVSLIFARAD